MFKKLLLYLLRAMFLLWFLKKTNALIFMKFRILPFKNWPNQFLRLFLKQISRNAVMVSLSFQIELR